jgi:hypothetical protein
MERLVPRVPRTAFRRSGFCRFSLVVAVFLFAAVSAQATPWYTATDLGVIGGPGVYYEAGYYVNFSPTIVNGYVYNTAGDLAYPFQTTPKLSLSDYASKLPQGSSVSDGHGGIDSSISYNNIMINANGYLVGIINELTNVGGQSYSSSPFYAKLQPDGSFGRGSGLWVGSTSSFESATDLARVIDINIKDQVVGTGDFLGPVLYDIHSGSLTLISGQVHGGSPAENILALDDQGRMLATGQGHLYLLTPDGVASNPVPVPEPSSFAILGVGAASCGLWCRRRFFS